MISQYETKISISNEEREGKLKIMITRKERRMNRHITFRVSNKLLVSLVLLAFIIGTGVNSYSWFTSSASSSSSEITVGTFKLDLDLSDNQNANALIFDGAKLQPEEKTMEKTINFINSGDIEMVLISDLSIEPKDDSNTYGVGDLNAYKVIANIYKNVKNEENKIYSTGLNGVDKDTFKVQLNSILDPKVEIGGNPIVFKHNDKLVCVFQFVLDGAAATKAHQGDTVLGKFTVEARQNINGAVYD
jgi:hypothetical protein